MVHALPTAVPPLVALAAGVATGVAYFALLSRNLDLYLAGAPLAGAALQAGRFLLAAAVLFSAVQFGALPLIACAIGFLAGRHLVLRRVRKEE